MLQAIRTFSSPHLQRLGDWHARDVMPVTTQCLVAALWFWLVTSGTGQFSHQGFFLSKVYDSVASSLPHLRTDVDPREIGLEAFTVNGRVHTYYGIFPALLRVVPNALFPAYYGQWNRLSCFIAALVCLLAFDAMVRLKLAENMRLVPTQKVLLRSLLVLAFGLGTPVVFILSSSFIYHEAVIWGLAGSLSAIFFVFRLRHGGSARSEFLFSCSVAVALLSRASFGIVLYPAHFGTYLWRRHNPARWRALPTVWPILPAVLGLLLQLWVNHDRFGHILTFVDMHYNYTVQRMPERVRKYEQYGFFNVRRIPTNLVNYFSIHRADYSSAFPFIRMARPEIGDEQLYDFRELTVSLTVSAPWLLLFAGGGLALLIPRGMREPPIVLLLVCLLGQCVAILMFSSISERYTAEFIPFLVALGAAGLAWPAPWPPATRWPAVLSGLVLAALVGWSVYVSCSTSLAWVGEYLARYPDWAVPGSFSRSVGRFLGGTGPGRAGPPESTQDILARAMREHNAGSYETAMELYHKVLEREPWQPQAHYNLAQIYNMRRQYANAQWEYEAALKADPQSFEARLNLGVVLYRQRKFVEAAHEFRQLVQASPRNPAALFNLGITLIEIGDTEQAIQQLTEAVRESPRNPDAHYYLGLAFERQKRFPEARAALLKALELAPAYADAYAILARVYSAQGDQRLAQEALTKAAELNRGSRR